MASAIRPSVRRIVNAFIRSEYLATWQAARIESGSYASHGSDDRDRFDRCHDAAQDGCDGSTHREHIADMREAFSDYVRDRRRNAFAETPYRVLDAADTYWADLEAWHTANGSIDQQVG